MSAKLLRNISSVPRRIFFLERILPYLTQVSKNEGTSALIIEENSKIIPKKALVLPELRDKFDSISRTLKEEGYEIETEIDRWNQKDGYPSPPAFRIYVRW